MKPPLLNVFVYGTLKRGQRNHERFCRGVPRVEEAAVEGWLYGLPFGFPALVVPEKTVLAVGTADYLADVEKQLRVFGASPSRASVVHGELLAFDDPLERLPALDGLEGFSPGQNTLYRRVLIPAQTDSETVLAWTYAIERPSGEHLPGGRWPP